MMTKNPSIVHVGCFFCAMLLVSSVAHADEIITNKPTVHKRGTLKRDVVETTPFVFQEKVYRLEWERKGAFSDSTNKKGFLRVVDREKDEEVSRFAPGYRFACAYAEGESVYVIGTKTTNEWYGTILTLFSSNDLKTWEPRDIYNEPDMGICNTSLCKAGDRYVASIELATAGGFPGRFIESKDLKTWAVLPAKHQHALGRYNAAHCLRWHEGWFYLFYLEAGKPHGYEQYVTRSRDLIAWHPSPLNPVLSASDDDRNPIGLHLSEEDKKKIAAADDRNNSDIDFCEHDGQLLINYSWGNQQGTEFLAEAVFEGSEVDFLTGWFPEKDDE